VNAIFVSKLNQFNYSIFCRLLIPLDWCGGCWHVKFCVSEDLSLETSGRWWLICFSTAIQSRFVKMTFMKYVQYQFHQFYANHINKNNYVSMYLSIGWEGRVGCPRTSCSCCEGRGASGSSIGHQWILAYWISCWSSRSCSSCLHYWTDWGLERWRRQLGPGNQWLGWWQHQHLDWPINLLKMMCGLQTVAGCILWFNFATDFYPLQE